MGSTVPIEYCVGQWQLGTAHWKAHMGLVLVKSRLDGPDFLVEKVGAPWMVAMLWTRLVSMQTAWKVSLVATSYNSTSRFGQSERTSIMEWAVL